MEVVNIEKMTKADRNLLLELSENSEAGGGMRVLKIPRDENGNPIGVPWEVIRERMYDNLSKHYGVDLRTL